MFLIILWNNDSIPCEVFADVSQKLKQHFSAFVYPYSSETSRSFKSFLFPTKMQTASVLL